jgi:hypothetical protein
MPRASRHYIPGYVWHITHRCHKKEYLRGPTGSDQANMLIHFGNARESGNVFALNEHFRGKIAPSNPEPVLTEYRDRTPIPHIHGVCGRKEHISLESLSPPRAESLRKILSRDNEQRLPLFPLRYRDYKADRNRRVPAAASRNPRAGFRKRMPSGFLSFGWLLFAGHLPVPFRRSPGGFISAITEWLYPFRGSLNFLCCLGTRELGMSAVGIYPEISIDIGG